MYGSSQDISYKYILYLSRSVGARRKRSSLWNFFEDLGDNITKCKLCNLKMNKNMARHFRLKHPEKFKKIKLLRGQREKDVTEKSNCWISRGWVKKYCRKVGDRKYQCEVCDQVLSMPNGLYSNMKRHIKHKHPYVFHEELESVESENVEVSDSEEYLDMYIEEAKKAINIRKSNTDGEDTVNEDDNVASHEEVIDTEEHLFDDFDKDAIVLSETDPDFEDKIKLLCNRIVPGKRRAKNPVWNFFDVVELNHVYSCLACGKHISIFPHSVANLKRHLRTKHQKQYLIMMKYLCDDDKKLPLSLDKYYFDTEREGQYKCKGCDDILICNDDDQEILFDHIKEKHLYMMDNQSDDEEYSLVVVKKRDIQL